MTIEEIIEDLDEEYYKKNNYYLSITEPERFAKGVAIKFGRQCFEVAASGVMVSPETVMDFDTFEDYLKFLETK